MVKSTLSLGSCTIVHSLLGIVNTSTSFFVTSEIKNKPQFISPIGHAVNGNYTKGIMHVKFHMQNFE